jgi:hypothetical protein
MTDLTISSSSRPSPRDSAAGSRKPGAGAAPTRRNERPDRVRRIRLPDRFYLPRRLANGLKVRDVMPWRDAIEYVSDGETVGMRMYDGDVLWITGRQETLLPAFREEFDGVDLDDVVAGLEQYIKRRPRLKFLWQQDLAALEDLRAEREEGQA